MSINAETRYLRPSTITEATDQLAALPDAMPLAGGTDLIVNLRRGIGRPGALVDLGQIAELNFVRVDADGLHIGAGVTLASIAEHPVIGKTHSALAYAASTVAGATHRSAATLGGNLCQDTRCIFYNQSEWWRESNGFCLKYRGDQCHVVTKSDRCYATYHGDVAPVLMVMNATAEISGAAGNRQIPLATLFCEDGGKRLTLAPGELVTAIHVPPATGWRTGYTKIRIREAIDFPLAGIAVSLRRDGDRIGSLRAAITGTNSAPLMIPADGLTGLAWNDQTAASLVAEIRKIANVLRTTAIGAKYRRRVLLASATRLVEGLWRQA